MLDDAKTVATVIANMGGIGVLAYYLLHLHKDSIKAFREELSAERQLYRESVSSERIERTAVMTEWRREKAVAHDELIERLDRIEVEVRAVRHLCESD